MSGERLLLTRSIRHYGGFPGAAEGESQGFFALLQEGREGCRRIVQERLDEGEADPPMIDARCPMMICLM